MTDFTPLETTILQAIGDANGEWAEPIRASLAGARVTERRNTGHGFYTSFESPPSVVWRDGKLHGPVAWMKDMGPGSSMGFILWPDDGRTACLEGYQNCDDDGETVDLRERDLQALAFDRLEWI